MRCEHISMSFMLRAGNRTRIIIFRRPNFSYLLFVHVNVNVKWCVRAASEIRRWIPTAVSLTPHFRIFQFLILLNIISCVLVCSVFISVSSLCCAQMGESHMIIIMKTCESGLEIRPITVARQQMNGAAKWTSAWAWCNSLATSANNNK